MPSLFLNRSFNFCVEAAVSRQEARKTEALEQYKIRIRQSWWTRQNRAVRYFDHNATHPVSSTAKAVWLDALERYPANPSSPHRWGGRAAAALDGAREKMAGWLGCDSAEIVWTSGATESNNAILQHLGRARAGRLLISAVEHPSVRMAARRGFGERVEEIPVKRSGVLDVAWLERRLECGGVDAVAVMAANNETGVLQPWREVADACARRGVEYFCDAAQWVGKLPAVGLGACSFVSGCGHKFGGPPGVGFLKAPLQMLPLLVGGPQEEGRRAGTENVAGVLAMVAALEEREVRFRKGIQESRGEWGVADLEAKRDEFVKKLELMAPGVEWVGAGEKRLWNTVAVLMPTASDCRRRWVVKLDKLGFAVSTGSACASGKEQPSAVMAAMGYAANASDRMLRISAGWETRQEDWDALADAMGRAASELIGDRRAEHTEGGIE